MNSNNLNPDFKKRNKIIFNDDEHGEDKFYPFYDLKITQLTQLLEENFIELEENQNSSPNTKDFLDFATKIIAKYPELLNRLSFLGYAVEKYRKDYRTTIDGCIIDIDNYSVPHKVISLFTSKFKHADEFRVNEKHLRCWFD
jgi:hypothetical protein